MEQKQPTAEEIKTLVEERWPGFKAIGKIEVRSGTITTYRGVLPPDIEAAIDAVKNAVK